MPTWDVVLARLNAKESEIADYFSRMERGVFRPGDRDLQAGVQEIGRAVAALPLSNARRLLAVRTAADVAVLARDVPPEIRSALSGAEAMNAAFTNLSDGDRRRLKPIVIEYGNENRHLPLGTFAVEPEWEPSATSAEDEDVAIALIRQYELELRASWQDLTLLPDRAEETESRLLDRKISVVGAIKGIADEAVRDRLLVRADAFDPRFCRMLGSMCDSSDAVECDPLFALSLWTAGRLTSTFTAEERELDPTGTQTVLKSLEKVHCFAAKNSVVCGLSLRALVTELRMKDTGPLGRFRVVQDDDEDEDEDEDDDDQIEQAAAEHWNALKKKRAQDIVERGVTGWKAKAADSKAAADAKTAEDAKAAADAKTSEDAKAAADADDAKAAADADDANAAEDAKAAADAKAADEHWAALKLERARRAAKGWKESAAAAALASAMKAAEDERRAVEARQKRLEDAVEKMIGRWGEKQSKKLVVNRKAAAEALAARDEELDVTRSAADVSARFWGEAKESARIMAQERTDAVLEACEAKARVVALKAAIAKIDDDCRKVQTVDIKGATSPFAPLVVPDYSPDAADVSSCSDQKAAVVAKRVKLLEEVNALAETFSTWYSTVVAHLSAMSFRNIADVMNAKETVARMARDRGAWDPAIKRNEISALVNACLDEERNFQAATQSLQADQKDLETLFEQWKAYAANVYADMNEKLTAAREAAERAEREAREAAERAERERVEREAKEAAEHAAKEAAERAQRDANEAAEREAEAHRAKEAAERAEHAARNAAAAEREAAARATEEAAEREAAAHESRERAEREAKEAADREAAAEDALMAALDKYRREKAEEAAELERQDREIERRRRERLERDAEVDRRAEENEKAMRALAERMRQQEQARRDREALERELERKERDAVRAREAAEAKDAAERESRAREARAREAKDAATEHEAPRFQDEHAKLIREQAARQFAELPADFSNFPRVVLSAAGGDMKLKMQPTPYNHRARWEAQCSQMANLIKAGDEPDVPIVMPASCAAAMKTLDAQYFGDSFDDAGKRAATVAASAGIQSCGDNFFKLVLRPGESYYREDPSVTYSTLIFLKEISASKAAFQRLVRYYELVKESPRNMIKFRAAALCLQAPAAPLAPYNYCLDLCLNEVIDKHRATRMPSVPDAVLRSPGASPRSRAPAFKMTYELEAPVKSVKPKAKAPPTEDTFTGVTHDGMSLEEMIAKMGGV